MSTPTVSTLRMYAVVFVNNTIEQAITDLPELQHVVEARIEAIGIVTMKDQLSGDSRTIAIGDTKVFPAGNIITNFEFNGSAIVELYVKI